MEAWIKDNFQWVPLGWCNEDGTRSDSFRFTYDQIQGDIVTTILVACSIPWFIAHFGSVSLPPTATALKAVDPNDTMGWHTHFDEWVRQGIIQP